MRESASPTAISTGPADEAGQAITAFNVTNTTTAGLFSVAPAVAADGTLTFTTARDANGTATITLVAQDNGGTANGGVDTSAAQDLRHHGDRRERRTELYEGRRYTRLVVQSWIRTKLQPRFPRILACASRVTAIMRRSGGVVGRALERWDFSLRLRLVIA